MRSEATLQADVRQLLLGGGLNLADHDLDVDLETQVGDGRRIDVEVGCTVIEVKKDLSSPAVLKAAEKQLAGYVTARAEGTKQQYTGVLTDGAEWRAYHLQDGELALGTEFTLKATQPDRIGLLAWLEGVLSTARGVRPTPAEITRKLGAESASYAMDRAVLASLYDRHKNLPTVQLKRQLWARLLGKALGTQFHDDDALFIEHTLLVNSGEIIAHLVLGEPITELTPATILLGQRFHQAQLYGVVEADFFDWVIEVDDGEPFVRSLARRLERFDWSQVEHDVLKALYESVIGADTRRSLGEYYTPDWLAEQVVATAVTNPLEQRVLDPSCGSGTFLFHAARRYLTAATEARVPLRTALDGLTSHVAGIDLHPVAVALARVTYLLAIGRDRLTSDERGPIRVPVYLGDSLQWQQRLDLFDQDHLVIRTGPGNQFEEPELRFSEHLLADDIRFDLLVDRLAQLANGPHRPPGTVPLRALDGTFNRLAVAEADRPEITDNFRILCELVDEGRNHIWSYYIRNLARPMWLARGENRVDVLVGNPPWLTYRNMSREMQQTFKEMSAERGLWHGGEVATHQDLSALFVARAVQQYLTVGGTLAFVVPNAVLDRPYFAGFRTGRYHAESEHTDIAFTGSWDLRRLRPHFFPRGAAVVFGRRAGRDGAHPLPVATERWTGKLPRDTHAWDGVAAHITREPAHLTLAPADLVDSPYRSRFETGATIYPKNLFFVHPQQAGGLGLGGGRTRVRSARSSAEKKPWKDLPDLEGIVESQFIRPVMLGESVLPYRVLPPRKVVLPLEGATLMDGEHPHLDRYPDLAQWWRQAEQRWAEHRSTDRLTLVQRLNFRRGLSLQVPGTPLRVVYGASGMHVVAALVDDPSMVMEHALYWGTVASREEGMYLCAILNTPVTTELVRPFMSYGKDERHVDKSLWNLPIPLYDAGDPKHRRLAELGEAEAARIAALDLDESTYFVRLRQIVRQGMAQSPHAEELDTLVGELLDQ
ncbi:N-6 DNA methylase [Streptomyces sp. NPDC006967]|uniref:N-6 DNA methylase n=1 Tax=Streptomyces sp. NPDC006967 TaxID=3156906 RepID=UPI0033F42BF7